MKMAKTVYYADTDSVIFDDVLPEFRKDFDALVGNDIG